MKWRFSKTEMKSFVVKPISDDCKLYREAYWYWYNSYPFVNFDLDMDKLPEKVTLAENNWIKTVRQAQFIGSSGCSISLGITKAALSQLEAGEKRKSITLKKLAAAAETLNCDLVYYFKPKKNARLSEYVWTKLFEMFKNEPRVLNEPEDSKAKILASIIRRRMKNAQFRKEMGWSLRQG